MFAEIVYVAVSARMTGPSNWANNRFTIWPLYAGVIMPDWVLIPGAKTLVAPRSTKSITLIADM